MTETLPAFTVPTAALVRPLCPTCKKAIAGTVWGALLRCRRCKTLLLLQAGQPVRTVAERGTLAA